MQSLDRTEQRIVGVLIEKQLSVPDSYPMSENALVDGCNQKSNRDPLTELATFQVAGALMALQEKEWVARVEGGGRVARFKHRADERLQLGPKELAVFAELLLRGAQAPGALKPRVARMGCHATPEELEAMLRSLAARKPALVAQLPLGPRERDRRWRHLLGDGSEHVEPGALASNVAAAHAAPAARPVPPERAVGPDLAARVAVLEQQVAALQQAIVALRSPHMGD